MELMGPAGTAAAGGAPGDGGTPPPLPTTMLSAPHPPPSMHEVRWLLWEHLVGSSMLLIYCITLR